MSRTTRKFFAVILLVLLLGLPFIDWRLGAVLWMSVWLVFIFQNLYSKKHWKFGEGSDDEQPQ
jgi:hypothetical protein